MTNLYNYSAVNKRKTWLLMTGFFIFIIVAAYFISLATDMPEILLIAVILSVVMSWTSYWYSDKMVLAVAGAKEIQKTDSPELYRLVENLCIAAGLPVPKIYIINDPAPNAFATGRNPQHAAIAFTSGILGKLEKVELEGVVAHELSHIGNRDILIATIATTLLGVIVLLSDLFWRWSLFGGHSRDDDRKDGRITLVITIIALVFAILAPLFAQLLQLAISRKREFAADADAALLTRYPEGLARALEKISRDTAMPTRTINKATAHMYIASPLKSKEQNASWFNKLWQTHPPVGERIARLRGL